MGRNAQNFTNIATLHDANRSYQSVPVPHSINVRHSLVAAYVSYFRSLKDVGVMRKIVDEELITTPASSSSSPLSPSLIFPDSNNADPCLLVWKVRNHQCHWCKATDASSDN
ncbi:hypothetical protein ACS0TY_005304 [Phlomoides rotata]